MEKLPYAIDLIEADYHSRLKAWQEAQPKPARPGQRALKLLIYFLFFLLLAFPVFA